MSIASVGGGGVSLEVMHLIEQVSKELRRDHRDAARAEAERALAEGLTEADEIRAQAGDLLAGAVVGGACTVAGGLLQAGAAGQLADGATRASDLTAKGADTTMALGKQIGEGFQAAGERDRADAREANARAEAAGRRADAERSEADEAKGQGERAREAYAQLLALEHASRMAALAQKA